MAFKLIEKGYFNDRGVDVMAFSDFYPAGHQSGVTLIMHGHRIIANGDIRFEQTPGQWQPVPKQISRIEDTEENVITTTLKYPDMDAHLHGFNPIIYPDFEFEYEVKVSPFEDGVLVKVDLDRPIDEAFSGKMCFNLELFPGDLFGKSYICDGKNGIFPRQPNGPTLKMKTVYEHSKKLKPLDIAHADREKLSGGNKGYNPIIADDIISLPYASGKKITVCPEDELLTFSVESKGADLKLYDGRMNHNNGWFVLCCEVPTDTTKNAIELIIRPHICEDWKSDPVIQNSQVGYHPNAPKVAVIELDKNEDKREDIILNKLTENGTVTVLKSKGIEWGAFLRYNYLTFDFSDVREEGLYQLCYGKQKSSVFRIAEDIYERGVWQPVVEYFLPVQMCHMLVREKYRTWHGRCHLDDGRMAPINYEQFDGAAQGPTTLSKVVSGAHIPGINAGGWHDAGDFDLRIESQTGEMYNLACAYEEFKVWLDETSIDQVNKVTEIHQPDGKNDILQQIEHGALSVIGGYKALGRLYHEIMCGDLRQYVLLGDPVNMTSGVADGDDERLVFTEDNPARELTIAAHLAGSYRALKDLNEELAIDCLNTAIELFEVTKLHKGEFVQNAYDPGEVSRDYTPGAKLFAACELLISTGDEKYRTYILENEKYVLESCFDTAWMVCRAIEYINDDEFIEKFKAALVECKAIIDKQSKETPYGIPYTPCVWGAGWAIQEQGAKYYYVHKAFPEICDEKLLHSALNFILGCHPGSNNESFASGVGSKSTTVAYGMNRADYSYIPGGVVSGTALIRPDLPELLDFPYLWQQKEYVVGGGSTYYLFLVLAVREVNKKRK